MPDLFLLAQIMLAQPSHIIPSCMLAITLSPTLCWGTQIWLLGGIRSHSYINFHAKVRHMIFWVYPHPPPLHQNITLKNDTLSCAIILSSYGPTLRIFWESPDFRSILPTSRIGLKSPEFFKKRKINSHSSIFDYIL